ncbi:hypothetical protein MKX03_011233 [Papaver bracteatum]|nr:hypothetical protein MKX03_011233 [Papaver bracteatum]
MCETSRTSSTEFQTGSYFSKCQPSINKEELISHSEIGETEDKDPENTDESVLILELKNIAEVCLVGLPNAGKSTLLGAILKAKPTVGHYAFTTLRPSIGNLNYDDFFSVTVADIPGIIKGAHENRGLGHAFLQHIERTKDLAYVVDLAAALDGKKGIPPREQLRDLVLELEFHQEGLSDRPSLVSSRSALFPVCAVLEEGVAELKVGLRSLVNGGKFQKMELDKIDVE